MEKIATENLFLLEFLVDSVTLAQKCHSSDSPPGETCVSFQFLDNAPLDVCEADFNPQRNLQAGESESVKSGKSCLFSLSPEQASAAIEQLDICVSIKKKMPPGWLPEKLDVGTSVIGISNLFNELINGVELSDGSSPTAKTLKDVFDINDNQGAVMGKISVYIRMSCFGKLIVTQFQMNLDDKSVLFKDKEGRSLYRYKKAGKKKDDNGETGKKQSLQGGYNAKCPQTPCDPPSTASSPTSAGYPNQNYPTSVGGMGAQTMMTPCNECGFMPNPLCLPPMASTAQMMMPPAVLPPPPPPDGNYQEIGASMGGNSLTIRVHKDKGRAEQMGFNDDCICGGETAAANQQQAFAMRPGASPNSPFSFRMGQCGDAPAPGAGGGNNVVVNPPVYTAPDGTQITEFSDPNKEMFILRIGKKSEGIDKKNNLELELQTPKGPPLKPIPKKETVETQYDPLDAGPDDTGSKKGSKGGKKKK